MRKLLLLRPEPGLSASAERARALGLDVLTCPLFQIEPLNWEVPHAGGYDGLLLTSPNALRCGGAGLERLKALPVQAVGQSTAEAARAYGFTVETVGSGNVDELLARLPPDLRLLHLSGRDHRAPDDPRIDRRVVYASVTVPAPGLPPLDGLVVAVHSPRAGARLAELASDSGKAKIAAISSAAAQACGSGWGRVEAAAEPHDDSLLALAAMLCQT